MSSKGTNPTVHVARELPAPAPLPQAPPPPAALTHEDTDLFDYALIRDLTGFVFGAVRRRRKLVIGVMVGVVALTALLLQLWPRTWHVESHLLAQRNSVIAALGNPGRNVPTELDAPTRAAREIIMRRDSLLTLMKQTDLVAHYWANRAPLQRLKFWVLAPLRKPMTEQDRVDAVVGLLEKQLQVTAGDNSIVSLYIDWPDRNMSYRLIETAQQNFLETRHVEETSLITDAITILESHAQEVNGQVKQALDEVVRLQGRRRSSGSGGGAAVPRAPAALAPVQEGPAAVAAGAAGRATEQHLNQVRFLLESKQRSISDLEEFRSRRLSELQQQLTEQRVIYSDQHPAVLDIQQRIQQLTQDSPQVAALRRDVEQLQAEYSRMGGKPGAQRAGFVRTEGRSPPAAAGFGNDDPELDFARGQLAMLTAKYQELTLRIDAARIELDTARAAFKYRFTVLRPAELPKQPVSPKVPLILIAAFVVSAVLAVVAAVLRDATSGKVLERWQVERKVGLPVLAEVKRK